MKVVIQRSGASSVSVQQEVVGAITQGLVLLVCVEKGDLETTMIKAAQKIVNIRMFNDPNQKMNLNINQVNGEILAISQFTLSWQGQKGNRPGFDASMPPEEAQKLFNIFCEELKKTTTVATGIFGAEMDVAISNQGPVTFSLEF